jgi:predicted GNAT family acetyltransferase
LHGHAYARFSTAMAEDVAGLVMGVIGGLAVYPEFRGQGLGTALSAALTTRFVTECGLSTLGVYPENVVAQRMYGSLGYRESLPLLGVVR